VRHAKNLGARVIREYVEPGRTATNLRRPALQQMLAELAELRPTFVIFYDLSRVARDEFDALWLLREIENNGSKLESTLERIANDEDGMLMYTFMAGINAHRSRKDGRKVKMGLGRKFADGGTSGPARLGYLNTRKWINGKEVRTIGTDLDRVDLVRLAFEAFATGEHSVTTLRDLLEDAGLRSRATQNRPAKPLSRNGVHRMRRDVYYIGIVTQKGVKRDGRHSAIIDPATFEKVQTPTDFRGSQPEVRSLSQGLDLLRPLRPTAHLRPLSRQRWRLRVLQLPQPPSPPSRLRRQTPIGRRGRTRHRELLPPNRTDAQRVPRSPKRAQQTARRAPGVRSQPV
jgi:DNA invertase Pin-like site-specific DNA recombinase